MQSMFQETATTLLVPPLHGVWLHFRRVYSKCQAVKALLPLKSQSRLPFAGAWLQPLTMAYPSCFFSHANALACISRSNLCPPG
jgi:hypothetical protein